MRTHWWWDPHHPGRIGAEIGLFLTGFIAALMFLTVAFAGFGGRGGAQPIHIQFATTHFGSVDEMAEKTGRGPGNQLDPPSEPLKIGWWGVPPGYNQGTTLFTWRGSKHDFPAGTLNNLEDMKEGQIIRVKDNLNYAVTEVNTVDPDTLTDEASDLLSPQGPPQVVLVSYEGWVSNANTYDRVVIVVAEPKFDPAVPDPQSTQHYGGG